MRPLLILALLVACSLCNKEGGSASDPVVEELYRQWMQEASAAFDEYMALRERRILEWSKAGASWDDDEVEASSASDGQAPPGDAGMDVSDADDQSASSHFEEVVSGGRMSREQMMMEQMLLHYNRTRLQEKKALAERVSIHAEHIRQALREEGNRLAAAGLITNRTQRPARRSPLATAADAALDIAALLVLIVLPWRMLVALREQRRTGARRPPPLFTKRD